VVLSWRAFPEVAVSQSHGQKQLRGYLPLYSV
jgi:hypothetical protein